MFSPPIYDGLNINLHLHSTPLLRPLYVDSDFLVKLLSLQPEPLVAVLSVYGEPESAGSVLAGNDPLQVCDLLFIPRGLGVVGQRPDPFREKHRQRLYGYAHIEKPAVHE